MADLVHAEMGPSLASVINLLRPCIRQHSDGSFVAPKDEALSDLITLAESMQKTIGMVKFRVTPPMASEPEPVAWECYYPGAGSIDSQTFITRSQNKAREHEQDGAEVTPLYYAPPSAALLAAEQRGRDAERETMHDFISHLGDWRKACEIALSHADAPTVDSDDQSYWRHQIATLDRLAAAIRKGDAPT